MNRAKSDGEYSRVRDYLVSAIKQNVFAPGDRLPTERELAERFKIGRGITRRALGELESAGLIFRQVGRGTFVKAGPQSTSIAPATDMSSPAQYVEARLRFEPELAPLVAAHATAADFGRLEELLKEAEQASNMDEFESCDAAFHRAIAAATHNNLVIRMYEVIHEVRASEHGAFFMKTHGELTARQRHAFLREHREILEALKRRDVRCAQQLLAQHLRNTQRRVLAYLGQ